MKQFQDPTERYSIIFLIVTAFTSIALHLIPDFQPLIIKLTELYLFLINSLIFAFGLLNNHRNLSGFTFWSVFTILSLFLIEVLGINTGELFGTYLYGNTLPTKLAEVSIIIPFNRAMLILAAYGSISKLIKNRYLRALISSIIIALLDILIQTVATKLGYWYWETSHIPLQNYVGVFFVSLIFSSILAIMKIHARATVFKIFLITQFMFYLILSICL
jgi:bisanhydrobacterioruberin hydratase